MSVSLIPPLAYLLDCSENSLHDMELSALDLSSQCIKRAKSELEQCVAHREAAGVFRWLINHREEMIELSRRIVDGKQRMLRFSELLEIRKAS